MLRARRGSSAPRPIACNNQEDRSLTDILFTELLVIGVAQIEQSQELKSTEPIHFSSAGDGEDEAGHHVLVSRRARRMPGAMGSQ